MSTTHLCLVQRLRMSEAIPLFSLYVSMVWTWQTLPFCHLGVQFNRNLIQYKNSGAELIKSTSLLQMYLVLHVQQNCYHHFILLLWRMQYFYSSTDSVHVKFISYNLSVLHHLHNYNCWFPKSVSFMCREVYSQSQFQIPQGQLEWAISYLHHTQSRCHLILHCIKWLP